MASLKLIRRSLCAAALTALAGIAAPSADASDMAADAQVTTVESGTRYIPLGIGKSVVIDLPRDAKDVLVANPAIANAIVRSTRRAYLIGVAVGQTNVYFFDADGRQIAGFDIAVKRDLNGVRVAMRQALPNADIRIEPLGADGVILTGTAGSPAEAQQAYDIAARLLGVGTNSATGEGRQIVNAITVRGRDQVMLKVTVSEVQRDVIKQLGINLSGSVGHGHSVLNFNTSNPFSGTGAPLSDTNFTPGWVSGANSVQGTLQAMERAGVMRTLAEPNLTAISGESASFLVGGEFPVPGGYACDSSTGRPICQISVQFKKFGVGLNFTPVVLSEGRISLKVMTEVSELSSDNSIVLQPSSDVRGVNIPSVRVRRADTTVEIPSGGALAMAGMIQEQTKQAINGVPGLMQVPILGTLFKSRDYANRQTELMVIVTPYIVRAVAQKDLSRPDDGFADASDPETVLLGKLNRIYGPPGKPEPRGSYRGALGFILD
ncbi:MAG: pilus assembly protein CpaC [Variibacter sp.]|jgi:pilus assembly protein CpaC|nr:pilus assembly protein CpaC [Variibacter sp.]